MPRSPQLDLLTPEAIWQSSLLAKIKGYIDWQVYEHLEKCGNEEIFRSCMNCGDWKGFYYKCNLKFCPQCNWRIARKRADLLKLWTMQISQPKHVVLTMKNFPILTRKAIRTFSMRFGKLRRQKVWKSVKGGCISTEITNEGNGWHLHAHILCDCRFLPADELAVEWGKLVEQQFGIVKVKDCRDYSYLGEITKYVVKPAQLVSWHPEEISQFIHAIKGVRFFRTFGTMFKLQRQMTLELERQKPPPEPCRCGCDQFRFETEASHIMHEVRQSERRR